MKTHGRIRNQGEFVPPKHFGFVIVHAQGEEPLRVMRHESFVGDNPDGGR